MFESLGVKSRLLTWRRWRTREAQGRRPEAGSETSVDQKTRADAVGKRPHVWNCRPQARAVCGMVWQLRCDSSMP